MKTLQCFWFFLPIKTWKNQSKKLLIIGPIFFSVCGIFFSLLHVTTNQYTNCLSFIVLAIKILKSPLKNRVLLKNSWKFSWLPNQPKTGKSMLKIWLRNPLFFFFVLCCCVPYHAATLKTSSFPCILSKLFHLWKMASLNNSRILAPGKAIWKMIYIPRMMERSSTLGIFRWVHYEKRFTK